MKFEKLLTTKIEFDNPNEFINKNMDEILMHKLIERYEGKCYKSCYIKSIDYIINRSRIYLSEHKLDGSAYVNIKFMVTCIIYCPGELIFGVKILKDKTSDGSIIGFSDEASINIMSDKILMNFTTNNYIPCYVIDTKYGLFKSISIIAESFKPREKSCIFYVVDNENDDKFEVSNILKKMMTNLNKRLENIKKNDAVSQNIEIFADLLYIYKTKKEFKLESEGNQEYKLEKLSLEADEFSKKKKGIFIRPNQLRGDNKECLYMNVSQEILKLIVSKYAYCYCSLSKAYEFLISDYILYISSLYNMIEYFSSPDKEKQEYSYALRLYKEYKIS